jgi:hypothetical protein
MSTPEERQANQAKVAGLIRHASKGNLAAELYLRTVAGAARLLDDLIDRDSEVKSDDIVMVFAGLMVGLNGCSFFVQNRDYLSAVQQVALNAWLDANEWENSPDATERIYAHVWRDAINDLLPAVAYLVGGWTHMREVSQATREQFKKEIT